MPVVHTDDHASLYYWTLGTGPLTLVAALLVSIGTPIATFYWLDPKIKELRDKHLTYDFQDLLEHWRVKKNKSDVGFSDFYHIQYVVRLKNTGALPVTNVVLSARPRMDAKTTIRFSTPVFAERRDDIQTTYILLKQAIGPNQTLDVSITFAFPQGFKVERVTPEEETEKGI